LASLTDLLEAESQLTIAKNNYTSALLEYKLAEIKLIKSKGEIAGDLYGTSSIFSTGLPNKLITSSHMLLHLLLLSIGNLQSYPLTP
jgi:hypothetical protein